MFPQESDPVIFYGVIAAVVVVLIAITVLFLKKTRYTGSLPAPASGKKNSRLAYQPEKRLIPPVVSKTIPRPVKKSPAVASVREISLIDGRSDLTDSLEALVEKYSLEAFTLATSDGLLFASSGAESAHEDAAHYSEIYANDPQSETPGIFLASVSHKGSDLVLIIRTSLPMTKEAQKRIESDTQDILNRWI
jgi:hypothetical protein